MPKLQSVALVVWSLLVALAPLASLGQVKKKAAQQSQAEATVTPEQAAELEAVITTELGVIRFEFLADKAPKHVQQFVKLARAGFYEGSAFHRVYSRGLIQGGDPLLKDPKTPRERWGTGALNQLPDEFNDTKHVRGIVSTVRIPGKPNSDGAQFFICASPQTSLDGQFSAFGRVTEGMDVVDRISLAPVDSNQLTLTPVRITSIRIERKKVEPFKEATVEEMRREVLLRTNLGEMTVEMEPQLAPETVRNFLKLVESGWYDHTVFHRLVPGFVVQGGMGATRTTGPTHTADKWVHNLKPEFSRENHVRGILSMARGLELDSANTSFFIVLGNAPHLDGKYTIFGKVTAGFDTLERIEKVPVQAERPLQHIELIEAAIKPQ